MSHKQQIIQRHLLPDRYNKTILLADHEARRMRLVLPLNFRHMLKKKHDYRDALQLVSEARRIGKSITREARDKLATHNSVRATSGCKDEGRRTTVS